MIVVWRLTALKCEDLYPDCVGWAHPRSFRQSCWPVTKAPCGVWWLPSWLGLQWEPVLAQLWFTECQLCWQQAWARPWQGVLGAPSRVVLVELYSQPHAQAELLFTALGCSKSLVDFRSDELFFWKKLSCFPRGVCCFHYFLQRKLLKEKDVGVV